MVMIPPIPMPRSARPAGYYAPGDIWNTVRGGLSRNANALIGLGTNLMSAPGSQGFAAAGQGWAQGNAVDLQRQQFAQQQDEANQTRDWIKANYPQYAGLPVSEAWQAAMKDMAQAAQGPTSDIQNYEYAQAHPGFEDFRRGSNQTVRAGLGQPVVLRNKQTQEAVPFMPMSDGTYMNPLTGQTANDQWEFDPAYVAAQRAAGTAYGTAQGGAQFNLPKAAQDVGFELDNIANLKADTAGMDEAFGKLGGIVPQQMLPTIPGTKRADFNARLNQIVGQNFLQAYSTLRGAGAITEAEGAKAQDAMGRLSQSQSKEAFQQALNDLEDVLKAGYARMQQQAGSVYQGTGAAGGTPPGGGTDLKTKYGLE